MKSVIFTCFFLVMLLSNPSQAQFWKKQGKNMPPASRGWENRIVNENVVWTHHQGGNYGPDGFEQSYEEYFYARTVDGGDTWISGGFPFNGKLGDLTSMTAIDDTTAWVSYVESLDNQFGSYVSKVFKTSNGGKDWVLGNVNIGSNWVNLIHFFDKNNGVIIADAASVDFNIYTTSNGGTSWSKLGGFTIPNVLNADEYGEAVIATKGDNIWFSTFANRVFYSKDKGLNWEVLNRPDDAEGRTLQLVVDDQNNIYSVDINADDFSHRLFRRKMTESTWTNITQADNNRFMYLANVPGTGSLISTNSADPKTRISRDNGNTWIVVDSLDMNPKGFLAFLNAGVGYCNTRSEDETSKTVLKYAGSGLSGLLSQKIIDIDISIYPNPGSDWLNIKMDSGNINDYWLLINDVYGNLLYKKEINQTDNFFEKVNITNFPRGIYNLTISNTLGSKSLNFTKI